MVSADFSQYEDMEQVYVALQRMKDMRLDIEWTIYIIEQYLESLQQTP